VSKPRPSSGWITTAKITSGKRERGGDDIPESEPVTSEQ